MSGPKARRATTRFAGVGVRRLSGCGAESDFQVFSRKTIDSVLRKLDLSVALGWVSGTVEVLVNNLKETTFASRAPRMFC